MQSRWHGGVYTVRREKKGEKQKERRGGRKKTHAYLFSSSTDTLIMHVTQTATVLSCTTLNPGVEVKGDA